VVNVLLAASFHCGRAEWFAGARAPTATAEAIGADRPTESHGSAEANPPCSRGAGQARVFGVPTVLTSGGAGSGIWLGNAWRILSQFRLCWYCEEGFAKSLVPSFSGEM